MMMDHDEDLEVIAIAAIRYLEYYPAAPERAASTPETPGGKVNGTGRPRRRRTVRR